MAWRSGWRGGRRAGCSSPQATAAGSHRPSLPCAADRLGRAVDRDAPRRRGPEAAAVGGVGGGVGGGVLVASAGLPPQATSVPASGMAAIPLSTRRRAVKFVPLFSSWFIALGDWGGQSCVAFGRSIGNSRQTLCQAGRPAKNGRCAGFYAQRSQTRTGK